MSVISDYTKKKWETVFALLSLLSLTLVFLLTDAMAVDKYSPSPGSLHTLHLYVLPLCSTSGLLTCLGNCPYDRNDLLIPKFKATISFSTENLFSQTTNPNNIINLLLPQ